MCGLKRSFFRVISAPLFGFVAFFIFFLIYAKLFNHETKDLFSTLAGAFFGAGSAFFLNTFQSNARKKQREQASLIKTEYIINIICKFNEQLRVHINQHQNKEVDYFNWEKITEYQSDMFMPNIDTEHLLFLLDHGVKGKETLNAIFLVVAEQYDVKFFLEKRNQMYVDYLDKTPNRDNLAKEQLQDILGSRAFQQLKQLTELLIKTNTNLIEDCKMANIKIRNFLNAW